jgi:hypothetical protein
LRKPGTNLRSLRIEVIVTNDCDINTVGQDLFQACNAVDFSSESESLLERKMNKFVLGNAVFTQKKKRDESLRVTDPLALLGCMWFDNYAVVETDRIIPGCVQKLRRSYLDLIAATRRPVNDGKEP